MRLKLTVKAPIRVGGREQQINKLEFVLRPGTLHAISPRKLAKLLLDKGERTIGDWNAEVLTRGQRADLTSFLSREGLLTPDTIKEIARYSVPCEHQRINEFQPHARDGFGKLFIPGSAIKGAIRSAVMYALVDEDGADRYVRRTNERKDRFARELNKRALQTYELPNRELKAGPHFDLLRAVKVSDAYGELQSRVENITIQSYTEDRRGRTASLGASKTIYVECLTPGSWVEFDLKVDEKILGDFKSRNQGLPFENEAELLGLVREFYKEVWSRERSYYGVQESVDQEPAEEPEKPPSLEEWVKQKTGRELSTFSRRGMERRKLETEYKNIFVYGQESEPLQRSKAEIGGIRDGAVKVGKIKDFYTKTPAAFRLGWGSGLLSTTVDMRLDEDNMGTVLNFINSKHNSGAPIDGPKSRKLVGPEHAPTRPMGWAELEAL